MSRSGGVERALEKLQLSLEAGQAYEGQQVIKTVYHRLRSRKKLLDSYQVLESGAMLQLQQGQVTCGAELGFMLLEAFKTDSVASNDTALLRVLHVLQSFPGSAADRPLDEAPKLCCKVALEAIRWARQHSMGDLALQQDTAGTPEQQIHNHLARYLWDFYGTDGLGWASLHFAHGSEPFRFAAAVSAAAEKAPEGELDLFVVRAALQILGTHSTQCLRFCREFLQAFAGICEHTGGSVPDTPLYRFLVLLLEALEEKSLPLVKLLQQEYAGSLGADGSLILLFEQITSRHFDMGTSGGVNGLLSRMFEMLNTNEL